MEYKAGSLDPEVVSYELEDGRHNEHREEESLTIAIREFEEEGLVAITYMRLGP